VDAERVELGLLLPDDGEVDVLHHAPQLLVADCRPAASPTGSSRDGDRGGEGGWQ
jgi:hypothetical protein